MSEQNMQDIIKDAERKADAECVKVVLGKAYANLIKSGDKLRDAGMLGEACEAWQAAGAVKYVLEHRCRA